MFGDSEKCQQLQDRIDTLKSALLDKDLEIRNIHANHERNVNELNSDHSIALKEKDFQIKHHADEKIKSLETEVFSLKQELAVAKKENTMLEKLVDVSSDIIDIKDLTNKLIEKLPQIDLKSLTVNNNGSK